MAHVRKRETEKKGASYDIQVKLVNPNTGEKVLRTMVWRPDEKMKPDKELIAANKAADEFEQDIIRMMNSASGLYHNPNVTFKDFAQEIIDEIAATFDEDDGYAKSTYVRYVESLEKALPFIGGRKVKDLTPAIMQMYFDELDKMKKTVVKVTPKPEFKEVLNSNGFRYRMMRYELNVQPGTLTVAMNGGAVSKEWAKSLCEKTGLAFDDLFIEVVKEEPYAKSTIHGYKRVVRTILSKAVRKQLLITNPASGNVVDLPPPPRTEIKCMDDEVSTAFVDSVLDCEDIRQRTGLLIFIYTGLRRGENTGLRWQNIDFKKKTITVETSVTTAKGFGTIVGKPKTKDSERVITMPDDLVEIIKEYKTWWEQEADKYGDRLTSDWLFFQDSGKVAHPGIFTKWLNSALNAAGIEHYTPHSLRHTNLSLQMASGVPIINISKRAGHAKTSTTTDMYGHAFTSGDRIAANVINDIYSKKKKDEQVTETVPPVTPQTPPQTPQAPVQDNALTEFKAMKDEAAKLGLASVDELMEYKAFLAKKNQPAATTETEKLS